MDNHEKLAILQKDLKFLEEEHKGSKELLDALHPGASYNLYQDQKERVTQLKNSIERKKSDMESLKVSMAKTEESD